MSAVKTEVIEECKRIAFDKNETYERRTKAMLWLEKLSRDVDFQVGNGGQTLAESAGIAVDPKAPGGQRFYTNVSQSVGHNEYARAVSEAEYNGRPLSTEVDRSYRTGGRK